MTVLMKTAFINDYHARIKAMDDIVTNSSTSDLHTMVQSVKASSDIAMSSVLMKELQQQLCDEDTRVARKHCIVSVYIGMVNSFYG